MNDMMYIHKGDIPPVFRECRKNYKHFDELHGDTKDSMKEILIEEQGGICAYCMGRIKLNTSTIEHYIPRNDKNGDPSKSLDYDNLMAVCKNGRNDKTRARQCDVSRDNVKLHIDPRNKDHIRRIKYKNDGEIYTDDNTQNNDLDNVLNLNNAFLKRNRKTAWERALMEMSKKKTGSWSREFVEKQLKFYNEQKIRSEYAGVIIYWLNKRLNRN